MVLGGNHPVRTAIEIPARSTIVGGNGGRLMMSDRHLLRCLSKCKALSMATAQGRRAATAFAT